MAVSQRERTFFARLGEIKATSHSEAAAAHLSLPVAERLKRSWALFETFRQSGTATPKRDDSPRTLYARARTLGLYRG